MNPSQDYKTINRTLWNEWTTNHLASDFYDIESFKKGQDSLNSIELDLLGDVTGLRILHLQCHFGQDSLSLARRGASVIGVDLSDNAVKAGNQLAKELNLDAQFIQSDVLEVDQVLQEPFDIIFTSYGTIGWLPDLSKWAQNIEKLLKPSGQFIIAEFHPVVWMFDDDHQKVTYNYFKDNAIVEELTGSYTDNSSHQQLTSVSWNHSLSEVFEVLRHQQLWLDTFREYNYSPYNCFSNMEEFESGKFRIKHMKNNLPLVYAMLWKKP